MGENVTKLRADEADRSKKQGGLKKRWGSNGLGRSLLPLCMSLT